MQLFDTEIEMMVLGSCMRDKSAIDLTMQTVKNDDWFYNKKNQMVFEAIKALYIEGADIDIVITGKWLGVNKPQKSQEMQLRSHVAQCSEAVGSTANTKKHLETLADLYYRRQVRRIAEQTLTSANNPESSIKETIEAVQQDTFRLVESNETRSFIPIREIIPEWLQMVDNYATGKIYENRIMTGFLDLDSVIHGLEPGSLTIIAGRPSQGKSQLAVQICNNVISHQKKPVAIFSIEMDKLSIVARLQCARARVNLDSIKKGDLTTEDMDRLTRTANETCEAKAYICDATLMTPVELFSHARILRQREHIELLIVDYLQIMNHYIKDGRERTVADISRWMKIIAKELNIPVIAVSQLRRPEKERKPMLSDLRESGALEQDADMCLMLHHGLDKKANKWKSVVMVSKNRNGKTHPGIEMIFVDGRWENKENRRQDGS